MLNNPHSYGSDVVVVKKFLLSFLHRLHCSFPPPLLSITICSHFFQLFSYILTHSLFLLSFPLLFKGVYTTFMAD